MSHTPGPWVVEDGRKLKKKTLRSEMLMVVAEQGGMPGLIVNCGRITKADEANARLISAAPDLLAALKGIIFCTDGTMYQRVVDVARAAIKKAEG